MSTAIPESFIEQLGQPVEAYSKEDNRLASFSSYRGPESAIELAKKGFFYRQNSNEVECFCCHKSVSVISLRQTRSLQSVNQLHLPGCEWDTPQNNVPIYDRTTVDLRGEHALEYIRNRAREIQNSVAQHHIYTGPINEERLDCAIYIEPASLYLAPTGHCPCPRCVKPESRFCCFALQGGHITTRCGYASLDCSVNTDPINNERLDCVIYIEPGSLYLAPTGHCPCLRCVKPETRFCCFALQGGHITATRCGYASLAKRNMEQTTMYGSRYATLEARISSFVGRDEWHQPDTDLAEAGFFYVGPGDNIECFKCHGALRNWDPRSNPWREHARWFPWCLHVRQEMGDRFIHKVLKITREIRQRHEDLEQGFNSDVVRNALMTGHSAETISREVRGYFNERGCYPGYEDLVERLGE